MHIVSKQKEAEMAMWKRRSKYDPMKAAAEDRRKKEEAKRLAQAQQLGVVGMPTERYDFFYLYSFVDWSFVVRPCKRYTNNSYIFQTIF